MPSFPIRRECRARRPRINVPGDGDCLFHALILQSGRSGCTPQHLRQLVADAVVEDPEWYHDLLTDWRDHAADDRAFAALVTPIPTPQDMARLFVTTRIWATPTVLEILALRLRREIHVWTVVRSDGDAAAAASPVRQIFPSKWKKRENWTPGGPPLVVSFHDHHFNVVT